MAIGTTAAIIGSAVIGAGAGLLGSKAQSKAAGQAADASEAAAQAQLQLGRESLALNQAIYGSNHALLSPFVSRGNVAGNQINALLGLGSAPAIANPLAANPVAGGAAAPNPLQSQWNSIQSGIGNGVGGDFGSAASAFIQANSGRIPESYTGPNLQQIQAMSNDGIPGNEQAALQRLGAAIVANNPAPAPAPAQTRNAGRAGDANNVNSEALARKAFDTFANSAGMDFQMDLARNEVQNLAGGGGWLQSGAAIKEQTDRAQQMGINNYFLPYMNLLGGQQAVGAQSGAAVAGVGSNFGNTAANINAGMGQAIGNNAANIGNLALAQGQNKANMWANLGSSFGNALGALKG